MQQKFTQKWEPLTTVENLSETHTAYESVIKMSETAEERAPKKSYDTDVNFKCKNNVDITKICFKTSFYICILFMDD